MQILDFRNFKFIILHKGSSKPLKFVEPVCNRMLKPILSKNNQCEVTGKQILGRIVRKLLYLSKLN